jgi:nucleoside-diphosphate-sugar epimerase
MRILITGGAGFIGSHLAEHLHRRAAVRVLDDLSTGHRNNLAGLDVEFVNGSILDRVTLSRVMRDVDYVYHLAAFVGAPQSVLKPHTCVKLNVTGLLNVLGAAATAGVRKLCFGSSAAVYGDKAIVPKREDMCPEPRNSTLSPSSMASSIAGSSVKPAVLELWRCDFSTSSDRAKTPPDLTVHRYRYFFSERLREDL